MFRATPLQMSRDETHLVAHVERIARYAEAKAAMQIHLSELSTAHRRGAFLRAAIDSFTQRVKLLDCGVYVLLNADIVMVFNRTEQKSVVQAVEQLRELFASDPLVRDGIEGFCSWYDLGIEYAAFLALVRGFKQQAALAPTRTGDADLRERVSPAIPPKQLQNLIAKLNQVDFARVVRRQAACAMLPHVPLQTVFTEHFVAISALQRAETIDFNTLENQWLFHYLTEILDKRMLLLLRRSARAGKLTAASLNLNLSSLVSQEFEDFDLALPSTARGQIVIELNYVDVFAHFDTYLSIRDLLHDRGYRICLDGVTGAVLPSVDRSRLDVDLVKLIWNQDLVGESPNGPDDMIRQSIEAIGRGSAVLCHCDGPDAVRFGRSMGIALYQGFHFDKLRAAPTEPPG
ncbi:MAG TPA: hypothetical protein VNT30_06130 [Stellaceae bacterium]|nr:hypothetical protein [Stellaceae bacterium]